MRLTENDSAGDGGDWRRTMKFRGAVLETIGAPTPWGTPLPSMWLS